MQIGAILTLAGQRKSDGDDSEVPRKYARREPAGFLSGASRVLLDVLGQSLLNRTISKLRDFGTTQPTVIAEGAASSPVLPSQSAKTSAFIAAWETAVSRCVQQGAELLLLLRVNAYSDLDYCELLQFHLEKQSSLTQVYGPTGSLDVALVNATLLRNAKGAYRRTLSTLIPEQERFFYRGYINRLSKPQDFRKLLHVATSAAQVRLNAIAKLIVERWWTSRAFCRTLMWAWDSMYATPSSATRNCFIWTAILR